MLGLAFWKRENQARLAASPASAWKWYSAPNSYPRSLAYCVSLGYFCLSCLSSVVSPVRLGQ